MMVRLDVTVATAPPGGQLSGLPIGDHVVYIDLSTVAYAGDGFIGGDITGAGTHVDVGDTVDNTTFNRIDLTVEKYL